MSLFNSKHFKVIIKSNVTHVINVPDPPSFCMRGESGNEANVHIHTCMYIACIAAMYMYIHKFFTRTCIR